MTRFPIRFEPWYAALSRAVWIRPSGSYVELDGGEVRVRMDWAFRAAFPRSAIVACAPYPRRPLSRGVHGFAGEWLVNGSADRVLRLELEPAQRAQVIGWPVRLRTLLVGVDDPDGLAAALGVAAGAPGWRGPR